MMFSAATLSLVALGIMISLIDIATFNKPKGAIPSVLTTASMIVAFILTGVPEAVWSGCLAFLIALLFIDLDVFAGEPDLKLFIAFGMTFTNLFALLGFAFLVTIIGLIYKLEVKKTTKLKEIPFVPALLVAYLIALAAF